MMSTVFSNRKNYLFVIGIDEYKYDIHKNLFNSIYDCERIVEVLTKKYNFDLIIDPLYNENATRENILDKLSSLSFSISEEDNLVIYYAGHGGINPNNKRGYWIPSDAKDSESNFISNGVIKEKIEDINSKHIFLISDSCFSGTFLNQTRSTKADFKYHYNKLDHSKSRWYLASGRIEEVLDGKKGHGSPFANSLLLFLNENNEKYISVQEIVGYVTKAIGNSVTQQPVGGLLEIRETNLDRWF